MDLRAAWARFWLRFNLRAAYSAERGASRAYRGHAAAAATAERRREVEEVLHDELRHRQRVGEILTALDIRPSRSLDAFLGGVGATVAFGCRFWGDWASAVGASLFEVSGAAEYRRAARFARRLGYDELAAELQAMQAQEEAHVILFRRQATSIVESRVRREVKP